MAADADRPAGSEQLRRRLYDADATPEDVTRFREAVDAERAAPTAPPPPQLDRDPGPASPEAAAAPRRRPPIRRPRLVIGAVAVITAAVILGAVLLRQPDPVAPATVAIDGQTRQGFVDDLRAGGVAGIAAYLVTHASTAAPRTATSVVTLEVHGTGSRTVTLIPPRSFGTGSGRATVLFITAYACDITWTAQRAVTGSSASASLATRGGPVQTGQLTTATFPYPAGGRPVRLEVSAPDGVPWGAAVVYSN